MLYVEHSARHVPSLALQFLGVTGGSGGGYSAHICLHMHTHMNTHGVFLSLPLGIQFVAGCICRGSISNMDPILPPD